MAWRITATQPLPPINWGANWGANLLGKTRPLVFSMACAWIMVRMKGTDKPTLGLATPCKPVNDANAIRPRATHRHSGAVSAAQADWGANWGAGFMRQRNRLTAIAVKAAGAGKLQDGGGLYIDRTATGGKWIFRYSFAGQRREMGLGGYPLVSLGEARKTRDKWEAVLIGGKDPVTERARQIEAERAEIGRIDPTFEDAMHAVFEVIKPSLRGDGDRGRWLSPLVVHVLPKLGSKRLSALHQSDIRDAIKPIWRAKHPTAQKALARVGIVLDRAGPMGMQSAPGIVAMARQQLGHVTSTPVPIKATRWQDAPALYARLGENCSHLALRFAMLTACRTDSVRGAMFDEIEGDVWTVPADRMKAREGRAQAFRVPLSRAAMGVVEICRARAVNGWLFASYRDKPVTENALLHALDAMGEAGRPHGFRTTFRMWVQDTQITTRDIAETVLAHAVGGKTENSYARSDLLDLRRPVMQSWADWVAARGDLANTP